MATDTIKQGGSIRRFIKAIEPWYNWGSINVERMDELDETGVAGSEGEVAFFELQWLGVHLQINIGRLPKKAVR